MIAAVACARMGSRRFPGKCLAMLDGKPLLQYTIDFARKLGIQLYIMSRDEPILSYVADKCPVIYEPPALYDREPEATIERLAFCNSLIGADHLVLLQPTQPVRDFPFLLDCLMTVVFSELAWTRVMAPRPVEIMDSGIMYTYSRSFLSGVAGDGRDFYFAGKWFDIDTPEEMKRCEEWLQRK